MKTAALLVIGDEILSGKIQDTNSYFFAKIMFDRGVRVVRIFIIPDDIPVIADKVLKCSAKFDYVCTSGGVGPTHDDKTFVGVGEGLSLPLREHKEAVDYFQKAQSRANKGEVVTDVQKKMLIYPEPCQLHFMEPLWLPLVVVKNVYVFPGVPHLFEAMLTEFAHLFKGDKFYLAQVYTNQPETNIAENLQRIQDRYPEVSIGSYPKMPGQGYHVLVTVQGIDQDIVEQAKSEILPLIEGRETIN